MTLVSSKEFAANHEKYFDLALDEQVFIKKGDNLFIIAPSNGHPREDVVFQPDDDFYRSIAMDEFKERAKGIVAEVHERVYYEPDEDFHRSISADEFKEGALKIIDKIFNR